MANWDNVEKSGADWNYNEINLSYNEVTDPDSGNDVFYNSVGTLATFINVEKEQTI